MSRSLARLTFVVCLIALSVSLSVTLTFAQADADPLRVAQALIDAENANDAAAAVALFASDAVVTLPTGVLDTPEAILAWQEELAAGHFHLEAVGLAADPADGSRVTWSGAIALDRFRNLGIAALDATWAITVLDGSIETFDFTFTEEGFMELGTGSVGAALIAAEAAGDVEAAVALFDADAVVTLPTGVLDTPEAIRAWQEELAAGNFYINAIGKRVDDGTISFVGTIALDRFREMGIPMMESEWVITVEGGLIQTFDFTFTAEALEALSAAAA